MRNVLDKRIPRELKKHAGKYIGIFLILVITIIIGSSFMATMDSALRSLEENDIKCEIEDGQFETLDKISDDLIGQLKDCDVKVSENFYVADESFDKDATLLVFNERKEMNLPSIFEGELPQNDKEIAIERLFASNRDINIGDEIELKGNTFEVTATIAVPDYNSLFKNNQDLLMNITGFGVSLVTEQGFERFEEEGVTYRYSYQYNEKPENRKEENKIVEKMQKVLVQGGATIQTFLTAQDNQSITFLRNDMGKDGPVMKVFVYILIMVIAFVFAIITGNTIEAEAPIIGTLRASGYKKSEIIMHYLMPTIIIALAGSVIGNAVGYTVMLEPFKNLYYGTYSISPLNIEFNMEAFVTTTILPVIIMIFINWFMLYDKLSLSPLKFLRKDLRKKKQKKAVKLPNVSFLSRFRLRVLIQNKVSYILLFVGIFISSFLLMFGIGLEPLFDHYVAEIDDSLKYEYQYILKAPVEIDDAEKLQTYSLDTWYEIAKKDLSVSFMGISENSKYFDDINLSDNKNEIVVSEPLALKMNLSVGDEIVFKDTYYEKEYTLKVSDIYDYKGSLTVFMKRENLNKLTGNDSDAFNSYLSDEKLEIQDDYLIKTISRADMVGVADQMMDSFEGIMEMINIFSVGVYMILMYILTKTVIEKNALSISFMKVFGYDNKDIGKVYLNATTITVMVSLFICIPVEVLSFKYILVYLSSMIEGYISFYLPVWVYVVLVVTGVLAYFAVNAIHIRKVRKIPMSEALKNRE